MIDVEMNGGLVIGIDIQEHISLVAYYDENEAKTVSVIFPNGKNYKENPISIKHWCMATDDEHIGQMEDIVRFFGNLIEHVKEQTGRLKIATVCVCVESFSVELLQFLEILFDKLGIDSFHRSFISREEAFAFYVYNQRKDLYMSCVMLLDYNYKGIDCYLMSNGKIKNQEVIKENRYHFYNHKITNVLNDILKLEDVTDDIIDWLKDITKNYVISSIFVTGQGFDVKEFPSSFTDFLCRKRKVFAGQNIYVKGACYCGYESLYAGRLSHMILACGNRITTGIELDILERGKQKRLRVIKPGINWYAAQRSYDFIVEDLTSLTFHLRPCDGSNDYLKTMDISEIPYRKGKMTKINMQISFSSENLCHVKITDKGFGGIVKSSGKVVYGQLDIM